MTKREHILFHFGDFASALLGLLCAFVVEPPLTECPRERDPFHDGWDFGKDGQAEPTQGER